jgi:hypothetical protein
MTRPIDHRRLPDDSPRIGIGWERVLRNDRRGAGIGAGHRLDRLASGLAQAWVDRTPLGIPPLQEIGEGLEVPHPVSMPPIPEIESSGRGTVRAVGRRVGAATHPDRTSRRSQAALGTVMIAVAHPHEEISP